MSAFSRSSAAVPDSTTTPGLQHVGAVGDRQRHVGVLLDHEDRRALAVDLLDDVEHLLDIERRQAHRRLVHADQPRPGHQRAADRHHLLLAAGQRAGDLVAALLHAREQRVDALEVLVEFAGRACGCRRPSRGSRTPSCAGTAAAPPAPGRCRARTRSLVEQPLDRRARRTARVPRGRPHHAHDGLHRGGLAAGIAAEQARRSRRAPIV